MIKIAKERYERELCGPNESRWKSCDLSLEAKQPLTRSKTSPYNRDVCFFCDCEEDIPSHYTLSVHCLQVVLWMLPWRKKEMKRYMSNYRLQSTVEMLMQLTSNIIKTAGLNMSQMCFVNTRPQQTRASKWSSSQDRVCNHGGDCTEEYQDNEYVATTGCIRHHLAGK